MKDRHAKYRDWKSVPIPDVMKSLPIDSRGYPVPANVMWAEGKPIFAANDMHKEMQLFSERKCSVSGSGIDKDTIRLVTSPLNALGTPSVVLDAPAHVDAVEYSMKVCPYLCLNNYYKYRGTIDKVEKYSEKYPERIFINPTPVDTVPPFMTVIHPETLNLQKIESGFLFIAHKIHGITLWKGGEVISKEEALSDLEEYMEIPDIAQRVEMSGSKKIDFIEKLKSL